MVEIKISRVEIPFVYYSILKLTYLSNRSGLWTRSRVILSLVNKTILVPLVVFLVALGTLGGYLWHRSSIQREFLEETYRQVASVSQYRQDVETETAFSDRFLRVSGTYFNDHKNRSYASYATTTLSIPEESAPLSFMLENVAVDDQVYVRVTTENESFFTTIPADGTWARFPASQIPADYTGIAIPGPVLDNLSILGRDGAYVQFEEKLADEEVAGTTTGRFRFSLKHPAPPDPSPVKALFERIGDGYIDAWIGTDHRIYRLVFVNPPYVSTTTISEINNPPLIEAPRVQAI